MDLLNDAKVLLGVVGALLGVMWHVHRFRKDHETRLSDLVEWRTRKDLADEQHDAELKRMHARLDRREDKDGEKWTRAFQKLDSMAEDVSWLKAHAGRNGGRQ